jgi:signal transduction histidine kinase
MTHDKAHSSASQDLMLVLSVVAAFWLVAAQWQFSETFTAWLHQYENLQLDELPLSLWVLSIGLSWFAFRRVSEIRRLLQTNRQLTQRLISAQEDERRLLAQELHDEVGQVCTALRIEASLISKAIHTHPDTALDAAQRIDQASLRMHSLARDMLKRLRPPNLDSLGIEDSIKDLCHSWEKHCQISCVTWIDKLPSDLADNVSTALYRITQEALTNIAKHAQATQVWVKLSQNQQTLTLTITDNGQGLLPIHSKSDGLGLTGMRERIASLHGHLRFENAQPGLRIQAWVPIPEASS